MSQGRGGGRLRVEKWELELAARIAGSFRPGDEDLKAELFRRVAEIKIKDLSAVREWQAFLAQSLYNAAKNWLRHEDVVRRRAGFMAPEGAVSDEGSPLPEAMLIAPEEPIESRLHLDKIWAALTPEVRDLAQWLLEEDGNLSALAQRLGRPRKTVEYWVRKLRATLKEQGLE